MILAETFGDKLESSSPLKLDEVNLARFLPPIFLPYGRVIDTS